MTPEQARILRRDIAVVLAELAHHVRRYDINAPRGRHFYPLRDALPRFGHGERVTPKHLPNLATVTWWVWNFMEWARAHHPRLVDQEVRHAAGRLLTALADVDISPGDYPNRRGPRSPQPFDCN